MKKAEDSNVFDWDEGKKNPSLADIKAIRANDLVQWKEASSTFAAKNGVWKVESLSLEEFTYTVTGTRWTLDGDDYVCDDMFGTPDIPGGSKPLESWKGLEARSGRYQILTLRYPFEIVTARSEPEPPKKLEMIIRGDPHTHNTKVDQLVLILGRVNV